MKHVLVFVALVSTLFGTTVLPRTVEELTRDSSDVIIGTAGQPKAVWNARHTMIYTVTPVRVEQALKGSRNGIVMVTQMGGTLDGITTKVAGVRQFQPSERAALFLRPSGDMPGTFVITGMMQGRFTVDANGNVSNGVPGVHVLDQKAHALREYTGNKMSLRELEQRVVRAK
jgi:hypothetical protein